MGIYKSSFDISKANKILEKYFGNDEQETVAEIIPDQDIHISIGDQYYYHENNKMVLRNFQKQFLRNLIDQISNHKSKKAVLKGVSGAGLTTSLIIIGQIAKEMGILVVSLSAKKLTKENYSLDRLLYEYLTTWVEVNQELIDKIANKEIINCIKYTHNYDDNAKVFEKIFDYLRQQHAVPVLFLVDDYNAFYQNHTILRLHDSMSYRQPGIGISNPIGRLFTDDIVNFPVQYGGALFTSSSDYTSIPTSNILTVNPFSKQEWKLLIENTNETRIKDQVTIVDKLGHLPRDLRRLEKVIQTDPSIRGQTIHATYLHEANEVYMNKIKTFYKKNKETLKKQDYKLFVLTGINIFMYLPCRSFGSLKLWLDSGFVFYDQETSYYRFSCEVARSAFITISREEISICPIDSSSDWLIFKSLLSFKYEREINLDSFFSPFNLEFKASSKIDVEKLISIEINSDLFNVSKSNCLNARLDDPEKPIIQIQAGNLVIFAERISGIDFVIVDKQNKLYFFRLSMIDSVQQESKTADEIFETDESLLGKCLYNTLKRAIVDYNGKQLFPKCLNTDDSEKDYFIHIQLSNEKSNANNDQKQLDSNKDDFEKLDVELLDSSDKINCYNVRGEHAKELIQSILE